MPEFFKDQKFSLSFYHFEKGIPTSAIEQLVMDETLEKSLVIAARGDGTSDNFHNMDADQIVTYNGDSPVTLYDIYNATTSIYRSERIERIRSSSDVAAIKRIDDVIDACTQKMITLVIVLAYDNGKSNQYKNEENLRHLKTGGSELVIEFMLSNFVHESSIKWVNKVDGSFADYDLSWRLRVFSNTDTDDVGNEAEKILLDPPSDYEKNSYVEKWVYDYSTTDVLSRMNDSESFEDGNEDDGFETITTNYHHHNINLKNLSSYVALIEIPHRVFNILNEDQKSVLSKQVPQILLDCVDEIGHDFFNQNFENYKSYVAYKNGMAKSQAWGAAMYDALAVEPGNTYLGDGISLSPSGKLVDDD